MNQKIKNIKMTITRINPVLILRVWRNFNSEPQKIFVAKEISSSGVTAKKILHLLIKMNLIKKVQAVYNLGNNNGRKIITGYKLK